MVLHQLARTVACPTFPSHPSPHAHLSYFSFSLLHLACGMGRDESVALLLGGKAKAEPNDADNPEGLTPLHAAAMAGSLACVELLIKHGEEAAELLMSC